MIHVNLSRYIIHAFVRPFSSMKFFNEQHRVHDTLCFIAASAVPRSWLYQRIGLKGAFKMGYAGQTSLVYTLIRVSHLQTEMTNDTIVIAYLFYRVRIISKTSFYVARTRAFCQLRVRKCFRRVKIEESQWSSYKFSGITRLVSVQSRLEGYNEDCYSRDVRKFL